MAAVTMHHFSGLGAPFVRSKGTVSGGVFIKRDLTTQKIAMLAWILRQTESLDLCGLQGVKQGIPRKCKNADLLFQLI